MSSPDLPAAFLGPPIAHRGLHGPGVPENSLAAVRAAAEAGYGIEIDLQPSADGVAMVFHDDSLDRLTAASGPIAARQAAELETLPLAGTPETIPRLSQVLAATDAPLLIELKDQSGTLGPGGEEPLARATAEALAGHAGPVAVMSFNPDLLTAFAAHAPHIPSGLVTCAYPSAAWPHVPPARRAHLAALSDLDRTGASFVSCHQHDLDRAPIRDAKANGIAVLTWTIRSQAEEIAARAIAENVTFEGYPAALT